MTREEAIAYGKRVIGLGLNDETQAFCELAIQALEQEPCNDVVSRQAVLECATLITSIPTEDWDIGDWVCLFRDRVSQLPPVRPQETVTEFADRCRECGAKYGNLLKQGRWILDETDNSITIFKGRKER